MNAFFSVLATPLDCTNKQRAELVKLKIFGERLTDMLFTVVVTYDILLCPSIPMRATHILLI